MHSVVDGQALGYRVLVLVQEFVLVPITVVVILTHHLRQDLGTKGTIAVRFAICFSQVLYANMSNTLICPTRVLNLFSWQTS